MTLDDKKKCNGDNILLKPWEISRLVVKSNLMGMEQVAADFHSAGQVKTASDIRLLIDDIEIMVGVILMNGDDDAHHVAAKHVKQMGQSIDDLKHEIKSE